MSPELVIKRERSPAVKAERIAAKSSNEILSELFGAFNAAPPDLRDPRASASPASSPARGCTPPAPASPAAPATSARRRNKKKHKKEKKRSRRSSSASSGARPARRHKRKKKKTKKERRRSRSRSGSSRSLTPAPRRRTRDRGDAEPAEPEPKVKVEGEPEVKREAASESKRRRISLVKEEDNKNFQVIIKNEDPSTIPMPDSPKREVKLSSNDLRLSLDNKHTAEKDHTEKETDKSKNKIQIKNLKFSAVFEETVKKAEEEARKKAERFEEGEYTDSSSGSSGEHHQPDPDDINKEFPKSSDPGGILQKKSEDKRRDDKDREKSRSERKRSPSHRSSRRKSKDRSRSRRRSTHRSRSRHRSRSKDRKKTSSRRSSSRSRIYSRHPRLRLGRRSSRSPAGVRLADTEKRRLLEVARRNAINMLKNGAVPAAAAALPPHTRLQVMAAIQSGGKSVDELTDFCKHLSKKEALGELSSVSSGDSDMSENEDTLAFHHPFLVKEKAPIVMNIRGGAPLPVKSTSLPIIANKEELRIQFPVSSGSQHRVGENEWRPVTPPSTGQVAKLNHKHPPKSMPAPSAVPAVTESAAPPLPIMAPPAPAVLPTPDAPTYMKGPFMGGNTLPKVPEFCAPGPQAYPPGVELPREKIDMSSLVSQKLLAIRKQAERNDFIPASEMGWSAGTKLGQFTGSTGVQILTPRELASGNQAWAKKDQLVRAAPVEGGMGMHLLQKMGWTPGKGLGKEETGALQPLLLEVKLDTKGLQAKEEVRSKFQKKPQRNNRRMTQGGVAAAAMGVSGKHPVSLLGEYCSKRKLGPPEYQLCFECGPDHKKNFLFKVKVAGVEYQPAVASINKKQAKADSAQIALQKLGVLP